jgi:hypothetical protein
MSSYLPWHASCLMVALGRLDGMHLFGRPWMVCRARCRWLPPRLLLWLHMMGRPLVLQGPCWAPTNWGPWPGRMPLTYDRH